MERIPKALEGLIESVDEAAALIRSGMTVGMSGFTSIGYPKEIPAALVRSGHARELTLCIGASTGADLDGDMAKAGLIKRRYSYQSNPDMRKLINSGDIGYSDMHVSQFPLYLNQGVGPEIDVAVVECSFIEDMGGGLLGIVPPASVGCSDALLRRAKRVILEVNTTIPAAIRGMHDIFEVGLPPEARIIPILHAQDRVGSPVIPCAAEKIAAVVLTDKEDRPPAFRPADDAAKAIAANIVRFLRGEIAAGRLPENPGPIQSGVGAVGNAVLACLADSGFRGLSMYTEVMQDAALRLIDSGVLNFVSASALSFGVETRKKFYDKIDFYHDRIVIRPQEISNHPEVIRRLGVIALNTPIEVDIYGNVNSTHIAGSRIMNGIGGSGDFKRNARVNIFATESTAKGGLISCIVPMVSHVDQTEHDTQVIITEQGIADLRWKTPRERAELLISNCAHPDYREGLAEYFEAAKKSPCGMQTPHDLSRALSWHQRLLDTGSMKNI